MKISRLFNKILIVAVVVFVSGILFSVPNASAAVPTHSLVKGSFDSVYFVVDNYRFTYPQDKYYFTWRNDFSEVIVISDEELAQIRLVNNILVRPGTKLVKIQSIPTVYAVGKDGMLYPVASEAAAVQMFGENWSSKVIDIQDSFWFNYTDTEIDLDGSWYPDGFLLKTAESDAIYVIWDGKKRLIASDQAFDLNRFDRDYIYTTTQDVLDSYDNGPDVTGMEDNFTVDSQGARVPS